MYRGDCESAIPKLDLDLPRVRQLLPMILPTNNDYLFYLLHPLTSHSQEQRRLLARPLILYADRLFLRFGFMLRVGWIDGGSHGETVVEHERLRGEEGGKIRFCYSNSVRPAVFRILTPVRLDSHWIKIPNRKLLCLLCLLLISCLVRPNHSSSHHVLYVGLCRNAQTVVIVD
ncbi:hypothetical protein BDP27DRAFT_650793 [Rhodocollybia butyracea]|uniref:Uncharacterized protein n=1 Tax=Rhodocollybia butyracea TaxID=206335 RepID=A0A9P5TX67_9AGAR|nr:hypothetical protein BDP27DRAFT_650793 [Rhodocollybia butyracea]